MLTEVGFWCDGRAGAHTSACDDTRPHPSSLVDSTWDARERAVVAAYVSRGGMVESWELGFSWCRFVCGAPPAALGSVSFTDGTFVWPEGFHHYIVAHGVRPPPAFVAHVLRCAAQASGLAPVPSAPAIAADASAPPDGRGCVLAAPGAPPSSHCGADAPMPSTACGGGGIPASSVPGDWPPVRHDWLYDVGEQRGVPMPAATRAHLARTTMLTL